MTSREIPDVAGGGIVQAAWGNTVAQRTVQRYASTAAFPTAAGEGELAYSFADDAIYFNEGGGWVRLARGDFVPNAVYARDSGTGGLGIGLPEVTILSATPNQQWDTGRAVLLNFDVRVDFNPASYGRMQFTLKRVTANPANLYSKELAVNAAAPTPQFRLSLSMTWLDTEYQPSSGYQVIAQGLELLGGSGIIGVYERSLTAVQI
jgi:hypothetical protein